MQADVKGDVYEGLLEKSSQESPKGAGQYFTPRELIKAIADVMQPNADDTSCDPAYARGDSYSHFSKAKTDDEDFQLPLRNDPVTIAACYLSTE